MLAVSMWATAGIQDPRARIAVRPERLEACSQDTWALVFVRTTTRGWLWQLCLSGPSFPSRSVGDGGLPRT